MPKRKAGKKTAKKVAKRTNTAKKGRIKPRKAKKAAKALKRAKKSVNKAVKKDKVKAAKKGKAYETTGIYEETTITCPGCGRVTKVIKLAGIDTAGMICQRCAKGEVEIDEMEF